jgi:acetyl-CoA carboxylase biotin carboxyl carrier protein
MSNPIDTKIINKLAEILDRNQLTTLKYEDESCKISLTREGGTPVYGSYVPVSAPAVIPNQPTVQNITAPKEEPTQSENVDYANSPNAVKSPMVGVVYLASNPNAPAYVSEGDTVNVGDTVCLIEAMKTYNPVKAHKSGRVTKILVEAGDPVEYGEPLIIIE